MADVVLGDNTYQGVEALQVNTSSGESKTYYPYEMIEAIETLEQEVDLLQEKADNDPVVVEDGYTYVAGLPQAVGINVARDGSVITVTSTLEDGSTSTSVMTLDDNDYPTKVVTDGVECGLTFTGFEDAAESTDTGETEA